MQRLEVKCLSEIRSSDFGNDLVWWFWIQRDRAEVMMRIQCRHPEGVCFASKGWHGLCPASVKVENHRVFLLTEETFGFILNQS